MSTGDYPYSYNNMDSFRVTGGGYVEASPISSLKISNLYSDQAKYQKLDMNKVKYDWCYDILNRINEVINSSSSQEDKLHAIAWLTKQGLK